MKITVLKEKYRCGCGKGVSAVQLDNALEKLGTIIDWPNCTFPLTDYTEEEKQKIREAMLKTIEDGGTEDGSKEIVPARTEIRDFLGTPPKLSFGVCFSWSDSVFTIDKEDDKEFVILITTKTGPNAVTRFKDAVELEYKMMTERGNTKIEYTEKEKPGNTISTRVKYDPWKILKERYPDFSEAVLKVDNKDVLFFPATVWIKNQDIYFEDIFDEDIIQSLVYDIYVWLWENKK